MKQLPVIFATLVAALMFGAVRHANAQSASPQQIQGLIANGQEQTALAELQGILQAHPDSGVAWYLTAEAQDASGNEAAARSALSNAEHDAPGLPFARPDEVTALQAHLAGSPVVGTPVAEGMGGRRSGISPGLIGIVGAVIVFLLLRMFFRRRRFATPGYFPPGYGQPGGTGPFPNSPFYGPSGGMGSGLGGSLLGGLAAGAGFAAGERVIDDVFGRNNNGFAPGNFPQDQNSGNDGVPGRDDGLTGNPGWDDGSNTQDDNFDPGNNW